jgi:hypothetical protein
VAYDFAEGKASTMRKFYCWMILLAALVAGPLTTSAQARTIRLFLIGNSFSQNATRYLPQLAKEGGHELIIGRAELGGCSLQRHWEIAEAAEANPDDPKGKQYRGKSLRMLLSADKWDIVTIQQASIHSGNVETYRPYAQKLRDYVKSIQPQAEVVMHQTWAYRNDARSFGFIGKNKRAQNQREMWENSRASYRTIAGELGLRLIPNGDAFWNVNSAPQWQYQKDANFNFDKPESPALPNQTNSLHTGYRWATNKNGKRTLAFDANHANDAGCYLGGLVWYSFLFGESPVNLKFKPDTVPDDFAAFLRQTAWQTVQESAVQKP